MRAPRVAVVMVTHGQRAWVERAIGAVRRHTTVPYQLVVVDNASPDGCGDWLAAHLEPGELVALDHNVGFAAGNDLGANLARAPVLCFLNSDAIVPPGWLEPLLEPFADADVVATAPLLVNPDGSVQEAGCNVDFDGTITPLGVGDATSSPDYCWPRPVQHASAACLLVRTAAFRRAGGFDCGYGVAYYEDVDLLTTLRAAGGATILVPWVHVVHGRGASTPDRASADARVAANRPRFAARHPAWLARRHHAHDLVHERHRYFAARDSAQPDRTLLVLDDLPDAPPLPAAVAEGSLVTLTAWNGTCGRVAAAWRARGVEVPQPADPSLVVAERLFHFTRVVASAPDLLRLSAALDAHQPQATRVTLANT